MDWRISLDRYLTSEPPDDFTPFVEKVYEYLPDNVWEVMESSRFIDSEIESAFLWHCMNNVAPEMTALHLINLYYKLKEKGMILRTKEWDGTNSCLNNSKLIHARAEHLGKFYANNLYLL